MEKEENDISADWRQRTALLLGDEAMHRLDGALVLVVGLGGVGGMAAEMIARTGVGGMTIVDCDTVGTTNLNRQIVALHSTLGRSKADVLAERLLDINPALRLTVANTLLDEGNTAEVLARHFDCVVDAIDTIAPKVHLIRTCLERGIPIVSSMGSGGKTDPSRVRVDDISRTEQCALARTVRQRLRRLGIRRGLTVVYSTEPARREAVMEVDERYKKSTTGTVAWMPAVFGCYLAAECVKKTLAMNNE